MGNSKIVRVRPKITFITGKLPSGTTVDAHNLIIVGELGLTCRIENYFI